MVIFNSYVSHYQRVTKTKTQIGKDIEGGLSPWVEKNNLGIDVSGFDQNKDTVVEPQNPKLLARHHAVPGVR